MGGGQIFGIWWEEAGMGVRGKVYGYGGKRQVLGERRAVVWGR